MTIKILLNRKTKKATVLHELPDDDPHFTALGRVAAAWSDFESTLDTEIYQLLKAKPKECACITAQMMGPGPRLKAIRALCELKGGSPTLVSKLNEFLNKTYEIAEERNRIVHDAYVMDSHTREVRQFEVVAQKSLKYGYKPVTVEAMNKTLQKNRDHRDRFIMVIRKRIYDELRARRAERPKRHDSTRQGPAE